MSYMQIASEETLRAGRKIVEQYGSWSAAIAKGERRDDGVVVLPAPPAVQPASKPTQIKKPARAA
ncbi:hypothetical protein [uncultured Brevundimonas sp.]|uniref:hypothetical protein n=1 Tax=Brevundimonas sp. TaxID=1871086 RepID=UPI0025E1A9F9|nr:hypothetical protein [uncultured Brevundimonas sp.]